MHALLFCTLLTAAPPAAPPASDTVAELVLVDVLHSFVGGMSSDKAESAAAAPDGSIYVLMKEGEVVRLDGKETVARWGGRGAAPGKFLSPAALAVGPDGRVYVFDVDLNAITIFTPEGRLLRRGIVPLEINTVYSLDVAADGRIIVGAASPDEPDRQVHVLCPAIECHLASFGAKRETVDPDAARFFQSGFARVSDEGILFAGLNPLRLRVFDPATGETKRLADSDLLPDGEPIAFERQDERRIRITNWYPRTTGVVELPDGRIVTTAFLPDAGESAIQLWDSNGELLATARIPGQLRVQDVLPNGDLLTVRMHGEQEVAVYRLRTGG